MGLISLVWGIGALLLVGRRQFRRIPGVADALEADALHHAAIAQVQARDDAVGQHGQDCSQRCRSSMP